MLEQTLSANAARISRPASRWAALLLSAAGALTGIGGTGLLALYPDQVLAVFILYFISNVSWITVAVRTRQWWLLLMNTVYLALSVLGLARLA